MAKATKQIKREVPHPEEVQSQAVADIVTALAENREAILATIGIVRQLNDMGVLSAVEALLDKRVDVSEIAIQQINQPAMHNTFKNGMTAFKFLGTLDPGQLQMMLSGVGNGFEKLGEGSAQKSGNPSLWKLGSSMRTPEVRQSIATMVSFLEGMGESFQEQKEIH